MGIDITDPARVAGVAHECAGVTLVDIAGVMRASPFINGPSLAATRMEMETSYSDPRGMCRTFAPVLAAGGGGAIAGCAPRQDHSLADLVHDFRRSASRCIRMRTDEITQAGKRALRRAGRAVRAATGPVKRRCTVSAAGRLALPGSA
jgi:hypothetical protein